MVEALKAKKRHLVYALKHTAQAALRTLGCFAQLCHSLSTPCSVLLIQNAGVMCGIYIKKIDAIFTSGPQHKQIRTEWNTTTHWDKDKFMMWATNKREDVFQPQVIFSKILPVANIIHFF